MQQRYVYLYILWLFTYFNTFQQLELEVVAVQYQWCTAFLMAWCVYISNTEESTLAVGTHCYEYQPLAGISKTTKHELFAKENTKNHQLPLLCFNPSNPSPYEPPEPYIPTF